MLGFIPLIIVSLIPLSLAQATILKPVHIDLNNITMLQQGAAFFVNHCAGCHSLKYVNALQLKQDFNYTQPPLFNFISAIPNTEATHWFGVPPPDLSLVSRRKSADWLLTYLMSFYQDPRRNFNSNNLLMPNTAMPDVLAPIIGQNKIITTSGPRQHEHNIVNVIAGTLSPEQSLQALESLVNFLVYVGEPAKSVRYHLGRWVIAYLLVLLIPVWLLYHAYQSDKK